MSAAPPPGVVLEHADDAEMLVACRPVIRQLRLRLHGIDDWTDRAWRMGRNGYRPVAAWRGDRVVALAGYRLADNLIADRFLYVDDLVVDEGEWRCGLGASLLAELEAIGSAVGCGRLVLDTAASNHSARAFYVRRGMHGAVVGFIKPLVRP